MRSTIKCILLTSCLMTAACTEAQLDKLAKVGQEPSLKPIQNPIDKPSYQPVSWPAPAPQAAYERPVNSLWQPGSRTFFRDQRARNVGDILRVKVSIDDSATLDNTTTGTRTSAHSLGAPNVFGLEGRVFGALPGKADPSNLLSVTGSGDTSGVGKVDRKEAVQVEMAALVTQVLPNGNLVIEGQQQVRVNYESRILSVQGVIRPEDISSDNIIESGKIAEARIAYGGEGTISDLQQPRIGSQIVDILSPF